MDADATAEAPPAAHPGPQVVEGHILLRHDQPIDIGGVTVPLGELLAHRARRCRHCSDGWVHRPQPDGTRVSAVCGCCVIGWRAEHARRAATPVTGVAVVSPVWQERARQRVARLERDLAALEAERTEKLQAAARSARATAQDEASLGIRADAEVEHLRGGVADAERKLALMRTALEGALLKSEAHAEARALALAIQADAELELERRRGELELERLDREIAKVRHRGAVSLERVDRDIAKVRRRLAALRIYGGLADAAPAAEGA
jgi:hypothetical protein